MRRREFMAGLLLAAATAPAGADAQKPVRPKQVKFLLSFGENDPVGQQVLTEIRNVLEELGWHDGRNVSIEIRSYGGEPERAKTLAMELVGLMPDVIVANSTVGLEAVRSATRTVPTVFIAVSDPVGAGHAASLAHPGGNVTGFLSFGAEMGGKWLELLKEIAPGTMHIAVLMDPDFAGYRARWEAIESAAPAFRLRMRQAAIRTSSDIESAISTAAREPHGALLVFSSALTSANSKTIIELAARYRLPAVYPFKSFSENGGLMSYGIDRADLFRRSASYIGQILRGADPGELPIQAPTKFELVINLKTAGTLGIAVPDTLLARADEVIQ
jgi:putative tryptophan/tyrosine transport system substrate-binding protein